MHRLLPTLLMLLSVAAAADPDLPRLERRGEATALIVDGKPFLMLAGELHNSSASGIGYMQRMWPHLKELGLNTVLAPVSWELTEPQEGRFDFTLLDAMLDLARKHDQRLVLLWFGSWKNGVSSYVPGWVLKDTARFPRAQGSSNRNTKDILSTLSPACQKADTTAFAALMRHLKEVDGRQHTVLMVQVENEVGIKPETRDQSETADAAFAAPVPTALMEYLAKNRDRLHPDLLKRWEKGGFAATGTWGAVFGGGSEADEVFSAWHYARYIDQVAAAGQAAYPLPMYVNAWLPGKLGTYPTGGPVAHMHDVWRAAASHIPVYAPDIYVSEFKEVCAAFARNGNPLMIPEISKEHPDAAARPFWVFAQHHGFCYAPFGIESLPVEHPLVDAYRLLRQLTPAIADAIGTRRMIGVYRQGNEADPPPITVGDHQVRITWEKRLPDKHRPVGGLVIQTGPESFIVAGYGFAAQFQATTPGPRSTRILSVELGSFDVVGTWQHELWLNGDETGANGAARIPPFRGNSFLGEDRPMILKVRVYRHD